MKNRRMIAAALFGVAWAGAGPLSLPALAQDTYPSRSIRMIVPFPPGGPVDTMARLVSTQLPDRLGQRIVVDNRPGAVGTLGTAMAAKSPADGYTVMMTIGAYTIVPALMDKMQYDAERDLQPVTLLASAPNMLVVKPEFPARTLGEFIEMARREPGKYTYSTAGSGSTTHVMTAMLAQAAGLSLIHVPFQGAAPSLQAVLGGQTDLNAAVSTTAAPMLKAGKLRALAIVSPKRSALFPDVPTYAELGYPGVRGDSWIGLFMPAGTPRAIVDRWHQELTRFMQLPDTIERLSTLALEPVIEGPEAFAARIRAELKDFADLASKVDLKGK
jgi:tripartite-type tricarboxylate transporter receptor subunit TctC